MSSSPRWTGRRRHGRTVLALALVLGACGLAACGGSSGSKGASASIGHSIYTGGAPGGTPVHGGTLTFSTSGALKSLDPALLDAANEYNALTPLYDQLVELLPNSPQPQPGVAESWTTSSSGLTWNFKIRHGIRFSNGDALTAADVVYSLDRIFRFTHEGRTNGVALRPESFKAVTEVSPYEVRLSLRTPLPTLLDLLANPQVSVVPEAVAKKESDQQFALHPIGSGPFVVSSFTPGTSLKLTRNPHYWRSGQPYLDSVNFNFVTDATQRTLTVRSNEAQIADVIPFTQINSLKSVSGARLLVQPFYNVDTVYWNTAKAPFNNVNVRRALNLATPREAIIKDAYRGYAEAANSVIPKGQYWDKSVPYWSYDLSKAKAELAKSPVPHGFSTTIYISGGDTQGSLIASILQGAWRKIGVNASIRQLDFTTFLANALAGSEPLFWFPTGSATSTTAAPDEFGILAYDYDRGNKSLATNYNNANQKAIIRQAVSSTSEAVREKDFQELQRLAYENATMIPLVFTPSLTLVSNQVHGYSEMASGWGRMEQTWLAG